MNLSERAAAALTDDPQLRAEFVAILAPILAEIEEPINSQRDRWEAPWRSRVSQLRADLAECQRVSQAQQRQITDLWSSGARPSSIDAGAS